MLLVHQAGAVKIGEVVRYTLTYTPAHDRILPTPSHLHLKVKNSSAIPLRAAWVHGPYALHVAAYPATFNPHSKVEEKEGVPEYEPMVKAGGSWTMKLLVPEAMRETGKDLGKRRRETEEGPESVTWIVEIASQILFSNSASVHFEVLVGRDERSLDLGFAAVAGHGHAGPGQIREQQGERARVEAKRRGNVQTEGVYSKAIRLVVEDTETLWDKPPLPGSEGEKDKKKDHRKSGHKKSLDAGRQSEDDGAKAPQKKKKIHLVIVTHGLHSNLGADMLFLKESIDATVKRARMDAKERKESYRAMQQSKADGPDASDSEAPPPPDQRDDNETATAPISGGQEDLDNGDDDEEQTIVRGFSGNAVRTENGIQYLGKRLAKYILRLTYPDQPFMPVKKSFSRSFTDTFKSDADKAKRDGQPAHHGSSVHRERRAEDLAYTFTSISLIGHSLGGLIQTYAIAYIHKHAPGFFEQIKPVNFICMASPMLGLSNENPMYVKFALDFGLVGRSGQDLGLTWRAPTLANKGWNAVIGGFGGGGSKEKDQEADGKKAEDPAAKPLLRILPTGPAHHVLRLFRNRTLYSNVVNDGIVPLRTSCLLFLDWRGLGKVDKARRENGLIGTVAEWGWAELTGANSSTVKPNVIPTRYEESSSEEEDQIHQGETVPLPDDDETTKDNRLSSSRMSFDANAPPQRKSESHGSDVEEKNEKSVLDTFLGFFRASSPPRNRNVPTSKKTTKALRRGQTIHHGDDEMPEEAAAGQEGTTNNPTMRPHLPSLPGKGKRPKATRGDSIVDTKTGEVHAPPRTSIFESAGDILHPPLPSQAWITDPSTRSRTIFHDRVYHPEDIPPSPVKRQGTRLGRSFSSEALFKNGSQSSKVDLPSTSGSSTGGAPSPPPPPPPPPPPQDKDATGMKVEEKIARAYHRDLSWRKVLVRLEPDAHNNMIVRRMFANAYGWPVIKHLCDTHFADTYAATTRDEDEPARERAQPLDKPIDPDGGEEVAGQTDREMPQRTESEMREARDELKSLDAARRRAEGSYSSKMSGRQTLQRMDSVEWDDSFFEASDGEDSDGVDERNLVSRLINPNLPIKKPAQAHHRPNSSHSGHSTQGSGATPRNSGAVAVDGHRGLAPSSPTAARGEEVVSPTFDSGEIDPPLVVADRLVQEPEAVHAVDQPAVPTSPGRGGVAEAVGLGKSVEEAIAGGSGVRRGSK